jgi:aspartate carbamoyltransferase catalytic subunit
MRWVRKDLIDLESLSREEIELLLTQAKAFQEVSQRPIKKVPALRGKTVVLCFLEPSTRTRASFELAAKRLSADILSFQGPNSSSLAKGETVVDTAKNIEAMHVDVMVIRHDTSGVPAMVARAVKASVVNAGDGSHEHPTQGLVDLFTIKEKKGRIAGLNVLLVGDILHSRVARSDIWGLTKMGANVTVCGPPPLVPSTLEAFGVKIAYRLDDLLPWADVVIALRLQLERQHEPYIPSLREYTRRYGIDRNRLALGKPDLIVMHPGPVNRGVELAADVADGPQSVILDQVGYGIAVRMAVLYLVCGMQTAEEPSPSPEPKPQGVVP